MLRNSQDWRLTQLLPDGSGLPPGRYRVFIFRVVCKTTYHSQKLFDLFKLSHQMKMAFRGKKKPKKTQNWSQNKARNLILWDQALICTASVKSFGLKKLNNSTTSFPLRLYSHKRALHFQWHSMVSLLSARTVHKGAGYLLTFRWTDSFVSNVGGRKSSKVSGPWKTKGTSLQVPVTAVFIVI